MKEKKLLFICTGCTCRSPMATWIALAKLKDQRIVGVEPLCRGLFVEQNANVNKNAIDALGLLGVPVRKKILPKELTGADLQNAHICACMTNEQKSIIKSKFGFDCKTIAELADYVEIPDPYGQNLNNYIEVAKKLDTAIEQIFERFFLEDKK